MMRPHGIMFHHFCDAHYPHGQGAISAADLRRIIQYLGPEKILPARDWLRRATANQLRPWDLCLTFDDNLRCQYDVAVPVLREFGLTAFFFVYTSVLRHNPDPLANTLSMTEDHLRDLHAEGHVIGLHSDTHPAQIGYLPPTLQELEYQTNFDELTRICGQPPLAMSHPSNSYNPHTLRILRKMGIKLGFRDNTDEGRFSELEFPRESHTTLMSRMSGTAACVAA